MNEINELENTYVELFRFFPCGKHKGKAIIVSFGEKQFCRWCVSYCGSGAYFQTLAEATAYCYGRRFCQDYQRDDIADAVIKRAIDKGFELDKL